MRFSPPPTPDRRMSLMARKRLRTRAATREVAPLTVSLPHFLVDGSDLRFREFIADLYAAVAGMQSLRRALARSVGLSAAEFSILLAIWHLQKHREVGITTIARHLHVAAAHITAEVGKLVDARLVKKTRHPQDTRAVNLALTKKGESILNNLVPLLRRINDRLFLFDSSTGVAVVSKFLKHVASESANSVRMVRVFSG
jgi:DNA-binding MarR family transcriptional regulator